MNKDLSLWLKMNEEEKQAIEWLKKADWFSARLYSPTILNLIDKQQKEIEELKNKKDFFVGTYGDLIELAKAEGTFNYISKDKIKVKIKELEKKEFLYKEERGFNEEEIKFNYTKRILKELLGDRKMSEEDEPKKVTMPEIEEMKRLTDELYKICDEFIKNYEDKGDRK